VICQVHTKIFVAVKTVPILDAFRLRGDAANGPPDPRTACAEIGPVRPYAYGWGNLRRYRRCPASAVPGQTVRRSAPWQTGTVCAPVDVFSSALFVLKVLHSSPKILAAPPSRGSPLQIAKLG